MKRIEVLLLRLDGMLVHCEFMPSSPAPFDIFQVAHFDCCPGLREALIRWLAVLRLDDVTALWHVFDASVLIRNGYFPHFLVYDLA